MSRVGLPGTGSGGIERVPQLPTNPQPGQVVYVTADYAPGGEYRASDFDIGVTVRRFSDGRAGFSRPLIQGSISPDIAGVHHISITHAGTIEVGLSGEFDSYFGDGMSIRVGNALVGLALNPNTGVWQSAAGNAQWPLNAVTTVRLVTNDETSGITAEGIRSVGDLGNPRNPLPTVEEDYYHVDPDTGDWVKGLGRGAAGGVPAALLPQNGLSDADMRDHKWKGVLVGLGREHAGSDWRLLTEAGTEPVRARVDVSNGAGTATLRVWVEPGEAVGAAGNALQLQIANRGAGHSAPIYGVPGGTRSLVYGPAAGTTFAQAAAAINALANASAQVVVGDGSQAFPRPASAGSVQNYQFAGGVNGSDLGVEIDVPGKTITLEHQTGHTLAEVAAFLDENDVDEDTTTFAILVGDTNGDAAPRAAPLDRPFVQVFSEGSLPHPTRDQLNALVQRIQNLTFSDIGGEIADAQVPGSFTRDSELTKAFFLGVIGLTSSELDDLLIGARVTGSGSSRAIVVDQKDGSTINLPVPDTTGGLSADDHVTAVGFVNNGQSIRFTFSEGPSLTVAVPPELRVGVNTVLPQIKAGANVTINRSVAGEITISATGGSAPVQQHHVRAGWSADTSISDGELSASSSNNTVTLPPAAGLHYLAIWRSDADGGDPTEVHLAGGGNSRNLFGPAVNRAFGGVDGKLIVSVAQQNASLLGGENARLV